MLRDATKVRFPTFTQGHKESCLARAKICE